MPCTLYPDAVVLVLVAQAPSLKILLLGIRTLSSILMMTCGSCHAAPLRRHGESAFNMAGRIGGDSGLTPRGQEYARALPEALENRLPEVCVCYKFMFKMCVCFKCMLQMYVYNACYECMFTMYVLNACYECMLQMCVCSGGGRGPAIYSCYSC